MNRYVDLDVEADIDADLDFDADVYATRIVALAFINKCKRKR
ncbi:hypothetical protein [Paraburkholderia sp. Ac-20347]|nr:hypothetical protein [Paraburkholderia sp. Ac-20347]